MEKFRGTTNAFSFTYDRTLKSKETVIVKMPVVSPNKRSVNDIGWQCDGDVYLYGTLAADPASNNAMWQRILPEDEINKTVSGIKIVNNGGICRITMRAILC